MLLYTRASCVLEILTDLNFKYWVKKCSFEDKIVIYYFIIFRLSDLDFKHEGFIGKLLFKNHTTNNYRHRTAFCGVTFPTVIWQYSVPLMAVISTADDSNRNSLMSSAALSTAKLLSEM